MIVGRQLELSSVVRTVRRANGCYINIFIICELFCHSTALTVDCHALSTLACTEERLKRWTFLNTYRMQCDFDDKNEKCGCEERQCDHFHNIIHFGLFCVVKFKFLAYLTFVYLQIKRSMPLIAAYSECKYCSHRWHAWRPTKFSNNKQQTVDWHLHGFQMLFVWWLQRRLPQQFSLNSKMMYRQSTHTITNQSQFIGIFRACLLLRRKYLTIQKNDKNCKCYGQNHHRITK